MMSAKMAAPVLLKIKILWNKVYYIIYSVYYVTNNILSYDSNYTMDVVMWPKVDNSSTCIREVIITSILSGFDQKSCFFEGWAWFKFNNLGLALGTIFHQSVERVKTKSQKVLGPNSYVCRSYRGKTGRGTSPPLSWIGLIIILAIRIKTQKLHPLFISSTYCHYFLLY